MCLADIEGNSVPGTGKSKCKCPERNAPGCLRNMQWALKSEEVGYPMAIVENTADMAKSQRPGHGRG